MDKEDKWEQPLPKWVKIFVGGQKKVLAVKLFSH